MSNNEFHKKASALAKKEGKKLMNIKEFFGKNVKQSKQMSENNYEGFKEAWNQNLDYYNSKNNLLIAFLLAVFSTLFIQVTLNILEKNLTERIFSFSIFGIMIFSFVISIYLLIILIIDRYQVDKHIRRNEKGMKKSLKIKKDSEKRIKNLEKINSK